MATNKKTRTTNKPTRKPKKRARRRTRNVPEAQRHTERVILRLDPDVAARLRAIASAWHVTLAEVVTDALDMLKAKPRSSSKPAK